MKLKGRSRFPSFQRGLKEPLGRWLVVQLRGTDMLRLHAPPQQLAPLHRGQAMKQSLLAACC